MAESLFMAVAAVSFPFRYLSQAIITNVINMIDAVGMTMLRIISTLVRRPDEGSLTAGEDNAFGWDDDEDGVDDDDKPGAKMTRGGSVGKTRSKPQFGSPR